MARYGVSLKIDVSKIDKARLFRGEKGVYLDATVFIDESEPDEYGNNGMITQDVTKEERERMVQGNILGNCKVFWRGEGGQAQAQPRANQKGQQTASGGQMPETVDDFEDNIPFN